ncbi:uncharacterized protein BDCG_07892 [Blastomyces dermatitidis ER-3]|uniref:DUF7728 domain-containing protein n=2 Tax=Ajellomyces dermatitidis TaxID=5039 RepID=F2TMS4_AJEDA|nr:uncharacterized protein BDCG_07892 [Blastomyces dermatitidis ER-3]EEQ84623.1 hypothetical protein BDCG_07892 [Blastomyces dermatitidis ER-3]EGE84537.1 hypothetical protein BDDG_07482 [Blastomyces dermatitidis ATCC 18188]
MMLPALLAASVLALPASSFLITGPAFREVNGKPHLVYDANVNKLELNVKCIQCPFPQFTSEESLLWDDGFDSLMDLNFTTEGTRLLVNKGQLYPMFNLPVTLETVLHRQYDDKTSFPLPIGYVFERLAVQSTNDKSGSELLHFNFMVIDVAGFPVPADAVSLRVLKLPDGTLFMLGADIEEAAPKMSWRQCRRRPKCLKKLIIARIRAIIEAAKARAKAAAEKIKGCAGMKGVTHPAGSHHHGSKDHSFARAFARSLHIVIVPALLGLSAALFACSVGFIVGHGIAALWARYRRSSRNCNNARVENGDDIEKEPLFVPEDDELPPQYEDKDHGDIALPAEKE